jgi:hypothetical protein
MRCTILSCGSHLQWAPPSRHLDPFMVRYLFLEMNLRKAINFPGLRSYNRYKTQRLDITSYCQLCRAINIAFTYHRGTVAFHAVSIALDMYSLQRLLINLFCHSILLWISDEPIRSKQVIFFHLIFQHVSFLNVIRVIKTNEMGEASAYGTVERKDMRGNSLVRKPKVAETIWES